jgi:hypothetical protein
VPGREELEDFDEAADGEPVLWRMREPSSRATPAQSTTAFFLAGRTTGEAQAAALAAHRGVWAPARAAPDDPGGSPAYVAS